MFLILAALSADASACSPGFAELVDALPAPDATEVPRNAVIHLQFGNGYLQDDIDVLVSADGDAIPGTIEVEQRAVDLITEVVYARFTPDALLPEVATIRVEVGDEAWTFDTSEDEGGAGLATPSVVLEDVRDDAPSGGAMSSCDAEYWRTVELSVETSADPGGALLLYRQGPDGDQLLDVILGPGELEVVEAEVSSWSFEEGDEECVYGVHVNAVGEVGEAGEIDCDTPGRFGCSSVGDPAQGLGLLALFGLLLGRRRR